MPDCFLGYSAVDEPLAKYVRSLLINQGLDVFTAAVSVEPGDRWSERIRQSLMASPWVVILVSESAAASPYVQQEFGMAIASGKKVIPITWQLSPSQLPGWMSEIQAVDLRGATLETAKHRVAEIAKGIQQDKLKTFLLLLALLVAAIIVFSALQETKQ